MLDSVRQSKTKSIPEVQSAITSTISTGAFSNTTYADLPSGPTYTLITRGGNIRLMLMGSWLHENTNGTVTLAVSIDGGAEVGAVLFQESSASFTMPIAYMYTTSGLTAGSHTFKFRAKSGGANVYGINGSASIEELPATN